MLCFCFFFVECSDSADDFAVRCVKSFEDFESEITEALMGISPLLAYLHDKDPKYGRMCQRAIDEEDGDGTSTVLDWCDDWASSLLGA